MIESLSDMPAGTIGFRISGRVTGDDYRDVLDPELSTALEKGSLRALFVVEGYEGFDMGALKEDVKDAVPLALAHREAWKRVAVVTDVDWIGKAMEMFRWLMPGEQKVFGLGELEEAKRWLAA
jgi:SpoIIAA-like